VVWGLKTLTAKEVIGPVEAETIYGPIRLTVRLDKNTFRLGEKINVTLTITNISNKTIVLAYSSPPKTDFAVYNSSSDRIFLFSRAYGWTTEVVSLVLEPSESSSQIWKWDQQKGKWEEDLQSVDPGTYYIAGLTGPGLYYLGPKDEYREDFVERIKVETPKIEIAIKS
jgi:hypothetical protein